MKGSRGQSIVESLLSISIIILVIVAVASLIVTMLKTKNSSFQRDKANELGQKVMEDLVEQKMRDPQTFWNLTNISSPQTKPGFDGYTYTIAFSNYTNGGCNPGGGQARCANADVVVTFQAKTVETVTFTRFFSRW